VTIVHGLPRFTADIYVDGELLLSGFRPREATDPLPLPASTYHVEIRDVGAEPDSPPALEADLTVPGGKDLSVVAHLDQNGEPTVRGRSASPYATRPRLPTRSWWWTATRP
jgi:hypothetical protein